MNENKPQDQPTTTAGYSRPTETMAWWQFWIFLWLATTIASGIFGFFLAILLLFTVSYTDPSWFLGTPFLVCLWGGLVGFLVQTHVAIFCWMFWQLKNPMALAMICGAITGIIAGSLVFSIFTAPLCAFAAHVAAKRFLASDAGDVISVALAKRRNAQEHSEPFSYSIADLFARMTVIAALLSIWIFVIRNLGVM